MKRDISIDESLMLYRGHHSLIRYIPNKAARFGFKIYAFAESDTGYIYRFIFDEGALTHLHPKAPAHFNKTSQIVWTLMRGFGSSRYSLLHKGHLLAVDNFYTDIDLFDALSQAKTDCLGTVRANRAHLPKSVLEVNWKKEERGSRILRFCDRFFFLNWMDKKPVRILSSISSGSVIDDQKGKPAVIHEHNRVMPGVDLNNQQKFGRKVSRRRVKKYYKNIFYHLFDIALVNAFIYFKQIPIAGFAKTTHAHFRILLVEGLLHKY